MPVIIESGDAYYYDEEGRLHREDGPAIERTDGSQEWFFEGERHRGDGPAIIRADGTTEWWWFDSPVPDSPLCPLKEMNAALSAQCSTKFLKQVWEYFRDRSAETT
jgi:hypothetical protein